MKVANLKISIFFNVEIIQQKKTTHKHIFREGNWVITIYQHSPKLVNATGLKSVSDITKVIHFLEERFGVNHVSYRIDSSMISHKDNKLIQMSDINTCLESISDEYTVDYEPEIFNAAFLKPKSREFPTINLFYTGSYQLLGGRNFSKIKQSLSMVKLLIKRCEKR